VELILDAQKFWFRKDLKGRKGKKQLEDRDAQRLHYAQLEHISPGASGHDPTEDDIERCFEHEWNSHMEWAKQFLVGNTDGTSLWDRLYVQSPHPPPGMTSPDTPKQLATPWV